ncbi:hypothetical protein Sme01_08630 [Sphaerisporangium melleum]|uniref:Uncharacterized protein n=1 Tax=Sphaerisporangium melleum TaxID=321316 RepID=A0A917QVW2_9ACTN|nr:hypothetical protein [Sphaerisporangium melleum]GGK72014.1 hypothetical protein GCM10007964_13560 [Sphaerisporangium melleum]GII68387.1 hypothetical protein Sme01_08630 [Sphaerisporangium melleum]
MNHVEDTLRRTLENAARQAPTALPGTLAGRLETRHQRRRHRAQALLAAAAVVLVAGGTAVGLRAGGGTTMPAARSSPTPSLSATASAVALEPVEKVWPQAAWTAPVRAPGGPELRPMAMIDDRTLLMSAGRTFGKVETLYAYDSATGDLRRITDVPAPKGTTLFATGFGLDGTRVAWWTMTKGVVHIWAAALDGGRARPVAGHPVDGDDAPDGLGLAGDDVVFSLANGGVYRVPLTGGPVMPVPDGAGLHLLSWPWAGTPGAGDPRRPAFTKLVNLATGQTSTAVVRDGERVYACGVRSCFGTAPDGKAFTRARDGSRQKEIPSGYLVPEPPVQSRFYVRNIRDDGPGIGLYDLVTGTLADTGIREEVATRGEIPVPDAAGRIMTYRLKNRYHVIDLSKIP